MNVSFTVKSSETARTVSDGSASTSNLAPPTVLHVTFMLPH